MKTYNIRLESGQTYNLSQIFSSDNKIIIPDLQRDYCWGDNVWNNKGEKSPELVSGFIESLITLFKKKQNEKLTLGLIYGYENPRYHIQLCDGQQRLTTLFLLMGLLNRKTCDNTFKNHLISTYEHEMDDKEPYLQYAIRESTLYFMSDLVCEFFLKKEISIDEISKQNWYFMEYNLDASIKSMISALKIIDKKLSEQGSNFDFKAFGEFIINNLQLLYYDMQNRTRGEETFVVINTTGEPLTATENLKPRLLGKLDNTVKFYTDVPGGIDKITCLEYFSLQWEEREDWFWKKRKGAGGKTNNIADYGVREFFRWVTLLKTDLNTEKYQEKLKQIRESANFNFVSQDFEPNDISLYLTEVQEYFNVVQFLFEGNGIFANRLDWLSPDNKDGLSPDNKIGYINTQIVWFQLLPVIEYVKLYGKDNERNLVRVKLFYENLSRIDRIKQNVGDLLFDAIRIIKEMSTSDIASILNLEKVSSQILSEEEKTKFELYINFQYDRIELEECFWKEEEHPIWNGEIMPLLKWSFIDDKFNFEKFENHRNVFHEAYNGNIDLTRRALITQKLNNYPRYFRGSTNLSFGSECNDWKVLINDNLDKFRLFFEDLINARNINDALEDMCNKFPSNEKWSEFVHIPELLEFCTEKNIQWWGENHEWILIKGKTAKGEYANVNAYKLYVDYKNGVNKFWNDSEWKIWFYPYENSCVVFDLIGKNIAIDVKYSGNGIFYIQLFSRTNEEAIYQRLLKILADKNSLNWNNKRYESEKKTKNEITEILKSILNDSEFLKHFD